MRYSHCIFRQWYNPIPCAAVLIIESSLNATRCISLNLAQGCLLRLARMASSRFTGAAEVRSQDTCP
jgi:hypothetical protein